MNTTKMLVGALFIALPVSGFSAGKTLFCDEPNGPRVDYFTHNTTNLENNKFIVGQDQLTDMHVRVVLNDNKTDVSFAMGDFQQLQNLPPIDNMKVVYSTPDQISFAGEVNKAPLMASYYPGMQLIIYSQQSVWTGDTFAGARSVMFYAKCHENEPNAAVPAAPVVDKNAQIPAPASNVMPIQPPAPPKPQTMSPPPPRPLQSMQQQMPKTQPEAPTSNIIPVPSPAPQEVPESTPSTLQQK